MLNNIYECKNKAFVTKYFQMKHLKNKLQFYWNLLHIFIYTIILIQMKLYLFFTEQSIFKTKHDLRN